MVLISFNLSNGRYPLALGILADMEEMSPSPKRPASVELYTMAINIARKHYCDMHVYPYTYMGNYYYRRCMYKEALSNWAAASQVISRYDLMSLSSLTAHWLLAYDLLSLMVLTSLL